MGGWSTVDGEVVVLQKRFFLLTLVVFLPVDQREKDMSAPAGEVRETSWKIDREPKKKRI